MHLLSEHDINTVFFDDVRVPVTTLVGKENQGWRLITSQLNHERVTLCSAGLLAQAYEEVVAWAQQTKRAEGGRVIDQEWVQIGLARVAAGLEFLRLINWKVAWTGTQGRLDVADASTIKVFGTEFYLESFRILMEIVGPRAYLQRGSTDAVGVARLEMLYRTLIILTFGGGTNEVQRDLIGMFGLGLPRMPRF
jgi:alkylation response protein AidB-like acyl-CoA dehydrogenase